MYDNELYENGLDTIIRIGTDELENAREGTEEERRIVQNLIDAIRLHDEMELKRMQIDQNRINYDVDAAQKGLEREIEFKRRCVDIGADVIKFIVLIGVNAFFICAEYAWQNDNTHLDQLAKDGKKGLCDGFKTLLKKH